MSDPHPTEPQVGTAARTLRPRLLVWFCWLPFACCFVGYTDTTVFSDGAFDLTVRVSARGDPPRTVTCGVFLTRPEAEAVFRGNDPLDSWSRTFTRPVVAPYRPDLAVEVRVPWSARHTMFLEMSRMQFGNLLVVGEWPDGRRVGTVVDIPDCRHSREVAVELP